MSIRAIKGITPEWYVPASEQDDVGNVRDGAAQFKLQPLTQMQLHEILPEIDFDSGHTSRRGIEMCLRYALLDWQGVEDADGAPLECSYDHAQTLPYYLHQELASQIIVLSMMSEEDRKKS